MISKYRVALASLLTVVCLSACSPEPMEASSIAGNQDVEKGSEPLKIMLMTKSQSNPYYLMMEQGARDAANDLGVTLVAKGTPNETHTALQKKMIMSAVEEEFDAVVFVPAKTVQLLPSLKQVQDQGMVLINLDDQINSEQAEKIGLEPIPFVGIDNQAAAQALAEKVLENHSDISSAYIILGPQVSSVSKARGAGFKEALAIHDKTLIGESSANWQYVEAYELSDKVLNQFPDIDAFFCANDVMALAVAQSLLDKGISDIKVIGYDAIPEAKALVEQGKLTATLDQQSYQQGALGVEAAVALLKGEDVNEEIWVSPELIVHLEEVINLN
ncbi:substrate-binding domain-containing protein [Vibrio sp. 10N.261.55.A7]|uniref:substrate-binding domain-containing protein n=1 Tax=Vibrio sp. 10N.261.55.A7 TaxID=1880851 RepID=UPI000C852EDE|nr:substrate-binding domain-containing protein [Vibrio sp. 10N.261.55.A7]PMK04893.1 hypothetical protein BCU12_15820 [Vibrio sp. 10N.261.55.A7]